MDNSVIAKSGWLAKQMTANGVRNWQRVWVELYRDGYLKWYMDDHSPNAEETILMPTECTAIKTGAQVTNAELVNSVRGANTRISRQCIFSVTATNGREWLLCGDTLDDMRAWQLALEQARLLVVRPSHEQLRFLGQHFPGTLNAFQRPPPTHLPPLYGHLPANYLPAFSDGHSSLTYVPNYSAVGTLNAPPIGSSSTNFALPGGASQPHQLHDQNSTVPVTPTRPDGRDVAMGMLAGAAVGSMMWGTPYFWW